MYSKMTYRLNYVNVKTIYICILQNFTKFYFQNILTLDDQATHMISVRKYKETKEFIDSFLAPLQILQNIMNHI